jgi:glycosyltransferase involved in cell wall biosynthesis
MDAVKEYQITEDSLPMTENSMRVSHLIKAKQIGGAERHLLMLLPALRERGIDARLLVLIEPDRPMDDLFAEAKERGIPAEAIPVRGNTDLVLINRIRSKLNEFKPDILHTHLIHADTFGMPAGKLAGVPHLITTRHNDDNFRSQPMVKLASGVMWSGFKACICISQAVLDFVQRVEHAPSEKLFLVRYGIEHQRTPPEAFKAARQRLLQMLDLPEESHLIGMACRLVEQKGLTYALEAMAQLVPHYPAAHLLIAGDGELMYKLKHQAADLEITDNVHFLGWRSDVPEIMMGLDIFLITSLWEGFGLVALEAMSKRLPVIASRVSALPEVIAEGETGLLIPPKDPEAIVSAISLLLDDHALASHMGLLAEDRVEQAFSVERMAEETIAVYRRFVPAVPSTTGISKRKVSIG